MRGFVLVELLIALAILSIAFFYLAPVSVNIFKTTQNKDIEKLNSIVQMAYKKAKESSMPQMVWGIKGSNNIHFDKKIVYLSKDVFEAKINEKYENGDKYFFFIYPFGIMDRVSLSFFGNKKIKSHPLLLRFDVE